MVLKQIVEMIFHMYGFRSLQTYMVLKLVKGLKFTASVLDPYKLTWFSNVRGRLIQMY